MFVSRVSLSLNLGVSRFRLTCEANGATMEGPAGTEYPEGEIMRAMRILAALAVVSVCELAGAAITPDDPGPADVRLTIDTTGTNAPISPYIYGSNSPAIVNRTFDRSGGNRMTGHNWETNASNAGSDYYHHNDYFLTGGASNLPPGSAVSPMLQDAAANGRGALVTVPMAGFVAADANGTVDETEIAPSSRWHEVVAKKTSIYPGSSLSVNPNKSDNYVFTDEFTYWVENTKSAGQAVFYSLDNEPALWGETLPAGWQSGIEGQLAPSPEGRTHPTIHPYAPTFAEMRNKTLAHAGAIKDVNPEALVFGGIGYGWLEAVNLQQATDAVTNPVHPGGDASGELHYYEWLLSEVAAEEARQGRTLMDVIDLHWYPEATGPDQNGNPQRIVFAGNDTDPGVVAARTQAARSLWDPTYTEASWITGCCSGGPIRLLPHLQRDIDDFKPGTKIAITEYNYGAGDHISGGVAQADVLGVLGREGVFAASWWDLGNGSSFTNGAFDMFRNFDGTGGKFGELSALAMTDNDDASAIYASVDADDPTRIVLVAINRTDAPLDAGLAVTSDYLFETVEVYQLTAASESPLRIADLAITDTNAFHYQMPAYSVSTLVLQATALPEDLNADGFIDGLDLGILLGNWGENANASGGELNGTAPVDGLDLGILLGAWNPPAASVEALSTVPEPRAAVLLVLAGVTTLMGRRTHPPCTRNSPAVCT